MADINFGKVFGTLIKEANECAAPDYWSALGECKSEATNFVKFAEGWNGYEFAHTERVAVCGECYDALNDGLMSLAE